MKYEHVCILPYPVAVVYATWISPDTVIPPASSMQIDARLGGHYRLFAMMPGQPDVEMSTDGQFDIVEPESRLRYGWEWNNDGEKTTIDVRFEAVGEHTRVHLLHSGFQSEDSLARHRDGWDSYFEKLIEWIASH